MNKQQIKTRIEELENNKKFEKDLQIDLKAKLDRSVERLIDINEELQELERDLEEQEDNVIAGVDFTDSIISLNDIKFKEYQNEKKEYEDMLQKKADMAHKEYLNDTYPSTEQKYGDFTGVSNEDR